MRLEPNLNKAQMQRVYTLQQKVVEKVAQEFNYPVVQLDDNHLAVDISLNLKTRSIEDEDRAFDTFYIKRKGINYVYNSMPAIPIPLEVRQVEGKTYVVIHPLTNEYSFVHQQGPIEFSRYLRFFLNEIYFNALHYTTLSIA